MIIGIGGDIHSREEILEKHFQDSLEMDLDLLVDLGDLELPYFDKKHKLRKGQMPEEKSIDVIVRNMSKFSHSEVNDFIQETFSRIRTMWNAEDSLIEKLGNERIRYRKILGNSHETLKRIYTEFPNESLLGASFGLDWRNVIRRAHVEYVAHGKLHHSDNYTKIVKPKSAILYLPWKADVSSVKQAMNQLSRYNLKQLVIMSHDYFSVNSVPAEYHSGLRECENSEQIGKVFEGFLNRKTDVTIFYGHIGFDYPSWKTEFVRNGTKYNAIHIDEVFGKLSKIELIE